MRAGVVLGLASVACRRGAEGKSVEIVTTDVCEPPEDPIAVIAPGDHVSWDNSGKQIKLTAVGRYSGGIATEEAASGFTTITMRLGEIVTQAA